MNRYFSNMNVLFALVLSLFFFVFNAAAQSSLAREKAFVESSGDRWFFTMIFLVLCGLGGAYYFWRKSRVVLEQPQYNYKTGKTDRHVNAVVNDVDADEELEWLRKATRTAKAKTKRESPKPARRRSDTEDLTMYTKTFQEKMRRLQYSQLPINGFTGLAPAPAVDELPLSRDEGLLSAVEQANEENESDEVIRELAVRVLAAFRTGNSVDALYQVALYDLSATVRGKAVSVLADFDHESVFEAILLACADPTREVRAAAARGLFRLNFDRAGAWTRLIETGEDFRMVHAARAAIESGIVQKSFDRLVHEDPKIAYEAFCLVALLIKSGEFAEIYNAINGHKDERVKFALLYTLKVVGDERPLEGLNQLYLNGNCPADVLERIRELIENLEGVPA